jgi:glutamine amidotransferase-like uncharacterized protein
MKLLWALFATTTIFIASSTLTASTALAFHRTYNENVDNPTGDAPLALVYKGPGACFDGNCSKVAADLLRRAGYHTLYVHPSQITARLLAKAKVYVQPGGDALRVRAALSEKAFNAIKDYVYNGGNYLGFCAGAFLASPWLDDNDTLPGLNIVPAYDIDHTHGDEKPRVEPIIWHGVTRYVYYQGGAAFRVDEKNADIIQGIYQDGTAVIVYNTYGKGRVAVSGAHPEAPDSWFKDDDLKKEDNTLDIALDMVRWVSGEE